VRFFSLLPACGYDCGGERKIIAGYVEGIQKKEFVFWVMRGMLGRCTTEKWMRTLDQSRAQG
jgi:hypothetical protein